MRLPFVVIMILLVLALGAGAAVLLAYWLAYSD